MKQLFLYPDLRTFYFDHYIDRNNKLMYRSFSSTEEYLDECVKMNARPHFFGPKYFFNLFENDVIRANSKIWTVEDWSPVKTYTILPDGKLQMADPETGIEKILDAKEELKLKNARGGWEPEFIFWPYDEKRNFSLKI